MNKIFKETDGGLLTPDMVHKAPQTANHPHVLAKS